jgi:hypothetical protein
VTGFVFVSRWSCQSIQPRVIHTLKANQQPR